MLCCEMSFQFTAVFEITYNDAKRNYIALIHNQGNCVPLNVQVSYLWGFNKTVLLEQKQGLLKSQEPKQGVEMVWLSGRDFTFYKPLNQSPQRFEQVSEIRTECQLF